MAASRANIKAAAPAHDSEQQAALCDDIEAEIMGLKAAYEQYFLGMERMPPTKRHDALKKQVNGLKNAFVRQTALKFRISSIAQKFTTYERLWNRTLQEIENGTYKRDLFKAKLHTSDKKKKEALPGASHFDIDEDVDIDDVGDDLDSVLAAATASVDKARAESATRAEPVTKPMPVAGMPPPPPPPVSGVAPAIAAARPQSSPGFPSIPAVAPAIKPVSGAVPAVKSPSGAVPAIKPVAAAQAPTLPVAARPPSGQGPAGRPLSGPVAAVGKPTVSQAPSANSSAGLSDQKIKAIYDAYVSAKKRCGEDTSSLSLGGVAETLKKQVPELMKQHNAKSVEFKVVIKEGKAILRAMPKE